MSDIAMCFGGDCPLKETCYCYRAVPSEYQYYFSEVPYKDGKCEYFWPIEKGMRIKDERMDQR